MTREMAAELQTAINLGNVEQSQLIARQLAESKAKIIVRVDEDSYAALTPEPSDMIRYHTFFNLSKLNLFKAIWYSIHN